MIQFNLLPDVKVQYLKARKQKRLVVLGSTVFAATAFVIFVFLFLYVRIAQTAHSADLSDDISTRLTELRKVKDLDKMLTVQNQLTSLPGLHEKKPVATRYIDFLGRLTPSNVSISQTDVDFTASTFQITGESNDIAAVNKFVDTLKFTKYSTKQSSESASTPTPAFSEIVLSSFARTKDKVTYTVSAKFNPALFNINNNVELLIPQGVTTRSQQSLSQPLFQGITE